MFRVCRGSRVGLGLICLLGLAAPLGAERYLIEPGQSRFQIKVGKAGFFSVFGHEHLVEVRRMSGEAIWDPTAPDGSSVSLTLESASLAVVDPDVKPDERAKIQAQMEAEALEVERYPTIGFVSTGFSVKPFQGEYQGTVTGELTLKGVTRQVKVPVQIAVAVGKLGARGRFKLKGSDFGVKQVTAAGGTVKTKDELELDFDLVFEGAR